MESNGSLLTDDVLHGTNVNRTWHSFLVDSIWKYVSVPLICSSWITEYVIKILLFRIYN